MGNYRTIEHDFVQRTMHLISQYESFLHQKEFKEQYNYTLLMNCLLGIIVMPKEKVLSHIPTNRITSELKNDMGLTHSIIDASITHLKELIRRLRNAIAHFSIEIISDDDKFLIDWIEFKYDEGHRRGETIAKFKSDELLPFMRYYADWLKHNLINRRTK